VVINVIVIFPLVNSHESEAREMARQVESKYQSNRTRSTVDFVPIVVDAPQHELDQTF
jgi:hypothetical protein